MLFYLMVSQLISNDVYLLQVQIGSAGIQSLWQGFTGQIETAEQVSPVKVVIFKR